MSLNRRDLLALLGSSTALGFVPWTGQAQSGLPRLVGYLRTNWSRDPFAFGSYSHIAKGSTRADVRALDEPSDDTLYFAGEAVFPSRNSTVHAAHESGVRAADRILDTSAQSIIIVGAGMAGMSAAKTLSDAGKEITVYEGRDRIGGRILTSSQLGVPVDLGASWIHGTRRNPLTRLAQQAGMDTLETDGDYDIWSEGEKIRDRDAPDWLDEVTSVQHSIGASSDQVNWSGYINTRDYGGAEVIFPTGYRPIFGALTGDYEVHLGRRVTQVAWGDNPGVRLSNGSWARADAVIVTAPLGVLKTGNISFNPALPQDKQQAIARLGMGLLDKVYLLFEESFWDSNKTWQVTPYNDLPVGQFNQWLNFEKYLGLPLIMAFNGGPPAYDLAGLSDQAMVNRALQTLRLAFA